MKPYDFKTFERTWQKYWLANKTFASSVNPNKPKYYILDMFPYPSGAGLHVGHPLGYTATDIIARKRRHEGYEVLHPMGWDAFGLPAENYALKTGIHPEVSTAQNIKTFRGQIQALGLSYDWDREFATTDTDYYKWTQWLFLQMYDKGLLYEKSMPMAWCPKCKIVVANEEVEQGRHERCGETVERKNLKQWMFRITDYADRLLQDLELLDGKHDLATGELLPPEKHSPGWPEKIKAQQRNWIGKSEGAEVLFDVEGSDLQLPVYTTRIDTIFSGTFLVMAPEHELVKQVTTPECLPAVETYIQEVGSMSDIQRTELNTEKTGAFTGSYAINPATGDRMPIWIADFVLANYGTGIVFADAHDERDFEMAKKFNIPLKVSLRPKDDDAWHKVQNFETCFTEEGVLVHSAQFDGLTSAEARPKIIEWLSSQNKATPKVNYKLRDWIFTRQRYWGEPIPIVHCDKCGTVRLPDSELPLKLPEVDRYEPSGTGESPLANVSSWVNTTCPKCGGSAKRETSTMPNWAGSSWYWLRYMDPKNEQEFCSRDVEAYFGPVDMYVGGAEHAVLHLLYARFWHKVLFDLGLVSTREPFGSLVNQGLILAEDGQKMSKSLGNVINPDDVVAKYGADTLRMYEMFMGPFEQAKQWNTGAMEGMWKFLTKIWKLYQTVEIRSECSNAELVTVYHQTIKKISEDTDTFKFNTAVSQMMIFCNALAQSDHWSTEMAEGFCVMLSAYAPHLAEEIWKEILSHTDTVTFEPWPQYDEQFLIQNTVRYAVQVNGKLRGDFEIDVDADKETVLTAAKAQEKVSKYLEGQTIVKEIFVPGKLVGFVVK